AFYRTRSDADGPLRKDVTCHGRHLTIPDPSQSYPTISNEEYARPGPFPILPHIITSPSPRYSQASRPRGSLQNLSFDSFIIELINPLAHHNSGDASTKPLRHLVGIGDLKYREVTCLRV